MLLVVLTVNISTLKGIHGTTKYHAESILVNGFKVDPDGKVGKAGRGVYFWHYLHDRSTAVYCANAWTNFAKKQGSYDQEKDCTLVNIEVEVLTNVDSILNFEGQVQESFNKAFPIGSYDESSYGAKLDVFIEELESNLSCKFNLVKINLSVPNLGRNVAFANSFPAIIIKDDVDINILDSF